MLTFIQTTILVVIALFVVLLPLALSLSFLFGPPYLPTPNHVIKEMLDLIDVNEKDVVIDLGSGDGAVLVETAQLGARARGYEINPFLVLLTKLKALAKGLRSKISVYNKPYQKAHLEEATIVFCYNMPKFIPAMEKKLKKELKPGTKILSYKFPLTKFEVVKKTKSGIYLYEINNQ